MARFESESLTEKGTLIVPREAFALIVRSKLDARKRTSSRDYLLEIKDRNAPGWSYK